MALSYVYQTIGAELAGNQSVDEFTALVRSEVSGAFRERQFSVALEDPHALERLCSEIAIAEGIKDCGVMLISARARGAGRPISTTAELRRAAKNAESSDAVRMSYQRDKKMPAHKHHSSLPAAPETMRTRLAREQLAQASVQKKISSAVGSARDSSEKTFKERICGRLAERAVAPSVTTMGLIQRARDLLLAESDCWYTTPSVPAPHIAALIGKDLARTVASLDPVLVKTARANSTLQRAYCANLEHSEAWSALEHYSNVGREMHQANIDARHGGGRGHGGGRPHGGGRLGPGPRWNRGPRFYGGRSHRGWGWRNGTYVDFDLFPEEYDIYGQPIVYSPGVVGPTVYAVPPPRPLLSFGAEAKPAQDIGARYYAGGYYPYSTGYAPYYGQTVVAAPQPVVYQQQYAPAVVVGGFRRPRPLISIGGGRRRRGIFSIGEEALVEAKMGMGGRTSTGRWTTSRESRSGGGRRSKMPPRDPKSGEFESKREHALHGSHQRTNEPIATELTIGHRASGCSTPEVNNRKKEKKEKKDKKAKKEKNYSRPYQLAAASAATADDEGWTMPTATQPPAAKPVSDVTFTPYPMPAARDKYPIAARVVAEQEAYESGDDEDDMPLVPATNSASAAKPAPQQQEQLVEDRDDWAPTMPGNTIDVPAGYVRVRITNLAYVGEKQRVKSLYVTIARDGGQEKFIGSGIIFGSATTRQLPLGPKYTFRFYAGPPGDNATAGPIKTIEESFGKDGRYSITIRTAGDKQTKFKLRARSLAGLWKNARSALVRSELSVPVMFTSTSNIAYSIGAELSELRAGAYTMSVSNRTIRVVVHPETEYSVKLSGGNSVTVSVDEDNALAKMQRHDLSALQPIANSVMFVRKGQDLLVAPLSSFKTSNAPTDEYDIAVSKASAPTKPIGSVLMNPSHVTVWSAKSDSIAVHDVFTHPADSSTLVVVVDPHEIHP